MLIERKIINQVTVLPQIGGANVQWLNQVLRDGEVISSIPHRKSYGPNMREDFINEVEGSDKYLAAIIWR